MSKEKDPVQEDENTLDMPQGNEAMPEMPTDPTFQPTPNVSPVGQVESYQSAKKGGVIRRATGAVLGAPGKMGKKMDEYKERGETSILDWTKKIEEGLDKGLKWFLPDVVKEMVNMGNISLADAHKLLPRYRQLPALAYKILRTPFKFLTRGAGTLLWGGWKGAMLPRHVLNLLGNTIETAKNVAIKIPAESPDPVANWKKMFSATGDYAKMVGMAPINLAKTAKEDLAKAFKYAGRGVRGSIFNIGRLIRGKSDKELWKQHREQNPSLAGRAWNKVRGKAFGAGSTLPPQDIETANTERLSQMQQSQPYFQGDESAGFNIEAELLDDINSLDQPGNENNNSGNGAAPTA